MRTLEFIRSKLRSHSVIFKFQDENVQASIDKHLGQPLPIFRSDTYRTTSACMHAHCPTTGNTQPDSAQIRVSKRDSSHGGWTQQVWTAREVWMAGMGSQRVRLQLRLGRPPCVFRSLSGAALLLSSSEGCPPPPYSGGGGRRAPPGLRTIYSCRRFLPVVKPLAESRLCSAGLRREGLQRGGWDTGCCAGRGGVSGLCQQHVRMGPEMEGRL